MFPENLEIDIDMDVEDEEESYAEEAAKLGRVPLYDLKKRQYVTCDGKVVEATEDEAIQQWVAFLILTKRDKFDVYKDTIFGTYLGNYIGYKSSHKGFVASELKREIEEGCKEHPLIDSIENFNMETDKGTMIVSFTIVKKDGTEMEVISDV